MEPGTYRGFSALTFSNRYFRTVKDGDHHEEVAFYKHAPNPERMGMVNHARWMSSSSDRFPNPQQKVSKVSYILPIV